MLKKLKMTTFAAVLCLFGFVLVPAAPVFAQTNIMKTMQKNINKCQRQGSKMPNMQLKCFEKLVKKYNPGSTGACSTYNAGLTGRLTEIIKRVGKKFVFERRGQHNVDDGREWTVHYKKEQIRKVVQGTSRAKFLGYHIKKYFMTCVK